MGDSLSAWRGRIGLFVGLGGGVNHFTDSNGSLKIAFFLAFLLLIGGVEQNPGPGTTIEDVYNLVMESKVTMEDNFKEVNNRMNKVEKNLNEKLVAHEKKILALEEENKRLKESLRNLENKQDDLENRSRRDNLLFFGVQDIDNKGKESWEQCKKAVLKIIQENMGLEEVKQEDIARAHRLGHRPGNRPIIVKFAHFGIKEKVLESRARLKNSTIFLSEDYSMRVRQERNILFEEMKAAREKGCNATVSFNKLKVDGRWYKYSWDDDKIVEIRPQQRYQETETAEETADQQRSKVTTRLDSKRAAREGGSGDGTPARGIDRWLRQRQGETGKIRGRGGRGGH